jgi:hypothetical protein
LNEQTRGLLEKTQLRETLTGEFTFNLEQRIARYLELKPHGIVPYSHFAAVSLECHYLFRDGHYYGTVALAQAVAEALVKFLCTANGWPPKNDFETNVKNLRTRRKITDELQALLTSIWNERDDYHHLNSGILQDQSKLEALAKEKLSGLRAVEMELFAYSVNEGKLVPTYPKYWPQGGEPDGTLSVYLRLD